MTIYFRESNNREAKNYAKNIGADVKGSKLIFHDGHAYNQFEMYLKTNQLKNVF